ncbi:phage tail tape measure protein [Rufibacter quisquiliarum]|uniref:TP901 family phage tail tape measure protein n=1 Tax=Rufibacter quisquiliarum TaxID=1549639 RepID=A0A839GWY7_9BACT|nr:phage tail tape measure protein [Rufibacter quisquiliarum]MBA9078938.1 TP901 family phage tail tape measure protein [Rufibacter quisquiliarum]
MNNYQWVINLVDKATAPMQRILEKADGMGRTMKTTALSASMLFYQLGSVNMVADSFSRVEQSISQAVKPGEVFESTMAEVKAITGATDAQLRLMEKSAIDMASVMGGSASKNLLSFKGVLGELGPQIADSPPALESMGRSVNILSKSMSGDTLGAMKALTTGLQQFNVDLKNPEKAAKAMTFQMNVMAAGANAGAAEVPQIADALRVAGVAASGARISFIETNAAIQVLAQGGLKGAEAGTALRNVIAKLGEGRFLPKDTLKELKAAGVDIARLSDKTLPFTERLSELNKIATDSALVTKLFGAENMNAANILIKGIPALGEFQTKLTGTNAAVDAANIIMDTHAGKMDRVKAAFENTAIAAFQALKAYLPYIQAMGFLALATSQLYPVLLLAGQGLNWARIQLWGYMVSLGKASLAALRFSAQMILTSVQGVGSFIISLVRGTAFTGMFATSLRLQATMALVVFQTKLKAFSFQAFIAGLWSSSVAAMRAGASWLWAGITGLPALVTGFLAATAAQWGLNAAMTANPIGAIIVGLLAIGTAVYMIIKHWDTVKVWLLNMGKWILKFNPFTLLVTGLMNIFPGLRTWFNKIWEMFTSFMGKLFGKVKFIWDKIAPMLGLGTFNVPAIDKGLFAAEDPGAGTGSGTGATPDAIGNNSSVASSLNSISGSGSKPTNINITIQKFQDKIEVHTTNMKEGVNDVVSMLEEGLTRVVNGINQVARD